MDDTERFFAFDAGFRIPHEEEGDFTPLLLISKDPFTKVNPAGRALPSPDFMLCASSTSFSMARAYFVRVVHPKHQSTMISWSGYVNMGKPQIQMQGTSSPHPIKRFIFPNTTHEKQALA